MVIRGVAGAHIRVQRNLASCSKDVFGRLFDVTLGCLQLR